MSNCPKMSNFRNQTGELAKLTHNAVNFYVTYESHQN